MAARPDRSKRDKLSIICRSCQKRIPCRAVGKINSKGEQVRETTDGRIFLNRRCPDCRNKRRRELWENGVQRKVHMRYSKTQKGILLRRHRTAMRYGVRCSLEEFYQWADGNRVFKALFALWRENNYNVRLSPSLIVSDTRKPITLQNLSWVTLSVSRFISVSERKAGRSAGPTDL